jgi:HEAT repeat protein
MNRRRYSTNRLVPPLVLGVTLLMPVALLCGGGCKSKPQPKKIASAPAEPPKPPPRKNLPIDPGLQSQARHELDEALHSNNPILRANAVEAAQRALGAGAANQIIEALEDLDPMVRFSAAMAAGEAQVAAAEPVLLEMTGDADRNVRVAVRFALHKLGNTTFTHDLETYARDPDATVRANTALALGLMGEPSGVKWLLPMRNDRSPTVRLQAAASLWRLGDREGLEDLVAASVSNYASDQITALTEMASPRNTDVIGHISGKLMSDYDEISLAAARAMGMLGSDAGYTIAEKNIKSIDPRKRAMAAQTFGEIGRTDAQPLLAPLLRDPEPSVRLVGAEALLQIAHQRR